MIFFTFFIIFYYIIILLFLLLFYGIYGKQSKKTAGENIFNIK